MMTSWHRNTARITGRLSGESTGNRYIPLTNGAELYDVTLMTLNVDVNQWCDIQT